MTTVHSVCRCRRIEDPLEGHLVTVKEPSSIGVFYPKPFAGRTSWFRFSFNRCTLCWCNKGT